MIEDDDAWIHLMDKLIGDKYTIHGCNTITEAKKIYKEFDPSVIFLDLNLPDSVGLEGIIKTNKFAYEKPIVVMSALDDESISMKSIELGACDYLVKGEQDKNILDHIIKYAKKKKDMLIKLKDSEQKYKHIFENIQDVYYEVDFGGNLLEISPSAEKLFDYTIEELKTKNLFELYYDKNDRLKLLDSIKKTGKLIDYEIKLIDKHKKIFYCSISSKLVFKNGNPDKIIGTLRDITHRKKLESQIINTEKIKLVGQLAGGIAHDFNNVLQSILGYSNLIKVNGYNEKFMDKIEKLVINASGITKQLMHYSGDSNLEKKLYSSSKIINDVVKLMRHTFDKRININTDYKTSDDTINCDIEHIKSAFINLALNSQYAMGFEGNIEFIIDHEAINKDKYVAIKIKDNGPGIPKDILPHIFEPYFTTKGSEGNGLGLASVFGIVQNHDGIINVDSSQHGTTFTLYFKHQDKKPSQVNELSEFYKGNGNILIVDDDEYLREFCYEVLTDLGYDCIVAKNGYEAIDKYNESIDLVIMDNKMPALNGYDAAKILKEKYEDAKILLSTGDGAPTYDKNIFINLIRKPYKLSELSKMIKECLE